MIKKKIDYSYISAGENICWLLNIRGKDLPNSPIANCKIIISKEKKIFFFANKSKIYKIKKTLKKYKIYFLEENGILESLINLKQGNFCIDSKTCSVFEEGLINFNFKIIEREDPIYILKSLKNKIEIKNIPNLGEDNLKLFFKITQEADLLVKCFDIKDEFLGEYNLGNIF